MWCEKDQNNPVRSPLKNSLPVFPHSRQREHKTCRWETVNQLALITGLDYFIHEAIQWKKNSHKLPDFWLNALSTFMTINENVIAVMFPNQFMSFVHGDGTFNVSTVKQCKLPLSPLVLVHIKLKLANLTTIIKR